MTNSFGEMGSLLKQAQQMQRELDRVREELRTRTVEGTAGGGAVRVLLPPSLYGVSPVRLTDLLQVAAAIETEPGASPNCSSMAEWLEGMSP